MQVVTVDFVQGKKVLLRYDIDVALRLASLAQGKPVNSGEMVVTEDFKLKAGIPTLKLCLENASKVIIIGHLGRPSAPSPDLSAKPIQGWFEKKLGEKVDFADTLEKAAQSDAKIVLLENIRFFHGEVEGDIDFAKSLAGLGDVYVNEAFSSHNKAASTTIVPILLPHVAGLHFAEEARVLGEVRDHPKKPFVAIMGGAKVADKLPVIAVLARSADAVLIGGKLISEIRQQKLELPKNVMVGKLSADGFDISPDTTESWQSLIKRAKMIVWNGPLGKFEDPKNDQSGKIAQLILKSGAEMVVGGGDTISLLGGLGLLERYESTGFVSVGGGAMLKFLTEGTLPTIEVLE